MIVFQGEELKVNKASQKIIWLYGAQWRRKKLSKLGIDEALLSQSERVELMHQLDKQEGRVRGLFGV